MKLMIVSENRRLLMEISHFFLGTAAYHVQIVHASPIALESFTETKPEFVILDESTIIPYRSMLRAFLEFSPQCKILIIAERETPPDDVQAENVQFLPLARLTQGAVLDALEHFRRISTDEVSIQAVDTVIAFGQPIPFRLYHDSYYVLYGKYIERGRSNRERLAFNIRRVGEELRQNESLDAVIYNDLDVLVVFRKSTHTRINNIIACVQRLCGVKFEDNPCYTVFAREHILWSAFEEQVRGLQQLSSFSYFYPGQIISAEYILQHHKRIDLATIDLYIEHILCAMLQAKEADAVQLISEFLFYHLKPNLDLAAAHYFKERMLAACMMIMESSCTQEKDLDESTPTVYDEYEQYKKYISIFIAHLKKRKMSDITIRALQYAVKNLGMDVSLAPAADELHVSKEYLSHIFKKDTGQTFLDFLQTLKVYHARLLLKTTDLKIYEIAAAVGYRDAQYFSRIMKRSLGVSPEQYRQSEKAKEAKDEGVL